MITGVLENSRIKNFATPFSLLKDTPLVLTDRDIMIKDNA